MGDGDERRVAFFVQLPCVSVSRGKSATHTTTTLLRSCGERERACSDQKPNITAEWSISVSTVHSKHSTVSSNTPSLFYYCHLSPLSNHYSRTKEKLHHNTYQHNGPGYLNPRDGRHVSLKRKRHHQHVLPPRRRTRMKTMMIVTLMRLESRR